MAFTNEQEAELWERWRRGEPSRLIARSWRTNPSAVRRCWQSTVGSVRRRVDAASESKRGRTRGSVARNRGGLVEQGDNDTDRSLTVDGLTGDRPPRSSPRSSEFTCTSATRTARGSAGRMRTPTGSCANTSPRAQTCDSSQCAASTTSPNGSTPARAASSAGGPQRSCSGPPCEPSTSRKGILHRASAGKPSHQAWAGGRGVGPTDRDTCWLT